MSQRYRKASITLLFTGVALSLGSGFVVVAPSLARVITSAHPMHEAAAWGKPSVTRDDAARVSSGCDRCVARNSQAPSSRITIAGFKHRAKLGEEGANDAA